MCSHLLMPRRHVTNLAFPDGIQKSHDSMTAKPKDHFHAKPFKIFRKQIGCDAFLRAYRSAIGSDLSSATAWQNKFTTICDFNI